MSKFRSSIPAFHLLAVLTLVLAACAPGGGTAAPGSTPSQPAASATPTVAPPPTSLTVCLGQEPASLFPLNNPSSAARAVLAALYDGPVDSLSYKYQPVILASLPTLENGDAQIFPVKAYVGDEVVDAGGQPVTLSVGTRLRPAGCRSGACAITYDGRSEVEMDQMVVTFRLLPGLLWSDGQPLTAADSVYSYEVSRNSYLAARTRSYEAADDLTVQWWGRPGYIDPNYMANFFMPLPAHLWQGIPADQLPDSEAASLNPAGWGPYVIEDWDKGNAITLVKNPHYFRAGEGLPRTDILTFRFTPNPQAAISALLAGECDVLDPSIPLDGEVELLLALQQEGQLQAFFTTTPVMEQLAFGIRPVDYDNGNNPDYDRPDYFGDPRVRRAVELCIDRQKIVEVVLFGLSSVPGSYVPPQHPSNSLDANPYDPAAANALLEEAGWRDLDGVPATTRQAWGIPKIANGTLLEVELVTSGARQRVQVSEMIAASLAQCGIKVNLSYLSPEELYNAGPAGPLFGRSFELAEYAMGSLGLEPPCEWFTTAEIPADGNNWIGTNLSGYSNPQFDDACAAARQSLPGETVYEQAFQQAQALFAQELPSLPLYWRLKAAAARPEVCGFSLDATASSGMWNVENLQRGENCSP